MLNIDKTEDRKNYIGGIDAPVIVLPNPKWKDKMYAIINDICEQNNIK